MYPLYVTYSIFRKRLDSVPVAERTLEKQYELWIKTVEENVFVICKTPMAKSITKRTLLGYRKGKINAHAFDDLINQLKEKPQQFKEKVLRGSTWNKKESVMKFNAVVGNPPYQIENKGSGAGKDPIYHIFIDMARNIADKGSLIHPARFLFNAGKTPKEWNETILNDDHIKVVDYWADSTDVFPNVSVMGGIAITFWDKNSNLGKIGFFSAYNELQSIINKVAGLEFVSFSELIYPRTLYKLTETLYIENVWANERPSKGHRYDVGSNVFEMLKELFFNEKPDNDTDEYAQIYGRVNNSRGVKWIKRSYLKVPDNYDYYKIIIPEANGSGAIGEVVPTPIIGQPIIGQPTMGHTDTFLSIGKFNNRTDAMAVYKYILTKFTRALLGSLKVTQHNAKECWQNVPLQDFTDKSDIDWSKSVAEIDQQLYKKYNLTQEEIDFIEKSIKPME